MRGGDSHDVPVKVLEATRYIKKQADDASASDDAERVQLWYRGLSVFHLTTRKLDPGKGAQAAFNNIAAFYSPKDKQVTVLDRGDPLDSAELTFLLAHEYVHALQDAEYDLMRLDSAHDQTLDSALGLSAIIEGEAVFYTDQLQSIFLGFDLNDVNWKAAFASYRAQSSTDLVRGDNPYLQLRSDFVYGYGSSYVYAAWNAGGDDAVRALHRNPPVSERQVIAGYREPAPGGKPWVEPRIDDVAIPTLSGFRYVNSEQLGSYGLFACLRKAHAIYTAEPIGNAAVMRLRSDIVSVQASDDGLTLLTAWRMRFADAATAQRVQDRLGLLIMESDRTQRLETSGRDVLILAMTPADATADQIDPTLALPADVVWGPIPDGTAAPMPIAGSARSGAMIP